MTHSRTVRALAVVFAATFAGAFAGAFATASGQHVAEPLRSYARPDSKLWLAGSTNIGSWSCQAKTFEAYIETDTTDAPRALHASQRIELKVAIRALDCGNKRMTADIFRALRDTGSAPAYVIGEFEVRDRGTGDTVAVRATGTLTVAGASRPIALEILSRRRSDDVLEAVGSVPLLMTDYGVTPPRAMLGLVRARDALEIHFALFFSSMPADRAQIPR
jgi:polyisoprenoid-binding protein YceI